MLSPLTSRALDFSKQLASGHGIFRAFLVVVDSVHLRGEIGRSHSLHHLMNHIDAVVKHMHDGTALDTIAF